MMRKVLTFLAAVMMLSTVAFAQNATQRVYLDSSKVGDSLVFPLYYAVDGVTTDFEVINTSNDFSVVAKVVVRSMEYSQELRDFFIYLSPNDVFRAKLYYANGNAYITSTDDSVCLGSGSTLKCGVDANFTYPLVSAKCTGDTNTMGYITVIQNVAMKRSIVGPAAGPVDKKDIVAKFQAIENDQDIVDNGTENVLTGFAEIDIPGAEIVAYNATALSDLDRKDKMTLGVESKLIDDPTSYNNTYVEVEAALAKSKYFLPYYDDNSIFFINFPTKLVTFEPGDTKCEKPSTDSPFFGDNESDFNPIYTLTFYDMKEKSYQGEGCPVSPCEEDEILSFPDEVNMKFLDSGDLNADMGWARLSFDYTTKGKSVDNDNVTYTGVPSIGLLLHITDDGFYLLDAPFKYGTVTYGSQEVLPYAPYVPQP